MGLALKNCGRDILFSACSWGVNMTHEWIRETGAEMWRSTGDIVDTWESVKKLTVQQEAILPYGGKGCFNDMDMLIVGMHGKGNVGLEGLTDEQYKTHFSIWALFASPLMIGCDIRDMTEETKKILTNAEMIRINQDADCRQVVKLSNVWNDNVKVYARTLENGGVRCGAQTEPAGARGCRGDYGHRSARRYIRTAGGGVPRAAAAPGSSPPSDAGRTAHDLLRRPSRPG